MDLLLREIVRCRNIIRCFENRPDIPPCAEIVRSQGVGRLRDLQVPEPWSGSLEHAPILFLISSPSINPAEEYPRWSCSNEEMEDYFAHRFGGGRREWIKDGTRTLCTNGEFAQAPPFWAAVRQRAMELLQRNVTPGIDYALTEVVHCKSAHESGVDQALKECAHLYLSRILERSGAKIIVVLGSKAKQAIVGQLGIPGHISVFGPYTIYGRERVVVLLPHPNFRSPRTIGDYLNKPEMTPVQPS